MAGKGMKNVSSNKSRQTKRPDGTSCTLNEANQAKSNSVTTEGTKTASSQAIVCSTQPVESNTKRITTSWCRSIPAKLNLQGLTFRDELIPTLGFGDKLHIKPRKTLSSTISCHSFSALQKNSSISTGHLNRSESLHIIKFQVDKF